MSREPLFLVAAEPRDAGKRAERRDRIREHVEEDRRDREVAGFARPLELIDRLERTANVRLPFGLPGGTPLDVIIAPQFQPGVIFVDQVIDT